MNKIAFLFISFIALFSCQTQKAQHTSIHQTIDAMTFAGKMNTSAKAQIIDVRTPGEFNGGHIANAMNIDYNDRKFEEEVKALDKNKPTLVYCLSGGRSSGAMKKMKALGFNEVYNLKGGVLAWKAANQPIGGAMKTASRTGLSMDEFKSLVTEDVPVLVDFNATWCKPCKMLKPLVKELENEKAGSLKVIYIDVDKNKEVSDALGIRSIPLLHVYKKGKLVNKSTGLISKRELRQLVK